MIFCWSPQRAPVRFQNFDQVKLAQKTILMQNNIEYKAQKCAKMHDRLWYLALQKIWQKPLRPLRSSTISATSSVYQVSRNTWAIYLRINESVGTLSTVY